MNNKKVRIAVIGASEIAFRRFLPSLRKDQRFEYIGVGISRREDQEKALAFQRSFGGIIFNSYEEAIVSSDVDALYIPQPPAFHSKYASLALRNGKHVLLEKPFTTSLKETKEIIGLAKHLGLAVHENYAFQYHKQIKLIQEIIVSGKIGKIREYRLSFGFPRRDVSDFRYKKELGGGALLDCGGYPIYLASLMLGPKAKIVYSSLRTENEFEVDVFGSVVMKNDEEQLAYINFGMDNAYLCELLVWGSLGTLYVDRVFTAPDDFDVNIILKIGNETSVIPVGKDSTFLNSIDVFYQNITNKRKNNQNMKKIIRQSKFVEQVRKGSK